MLHPPQPGIVGYVLGGPVVAAAGLIAGAAVVVMLSAVLGGHDPRSPFVRLMLIVCVITGRRPGDYLPPMSPPPETKLAAGPPAITQSDRMPLQFTEYISGEYVTLPVVRAVVAGCPDNSVMSQALRDSPFVCAPFLALTQRPFCPFPSFRRTGCVRWVAALGAWMRMRSGRPVGTCWLGMRHLSPGRRGAARRRAPGTGACARGAGG
jgi:hypothetical protein